MVGTIMLNAIRVEGFSPKFAKVVGWNLLSRQMFSDLRHIEANA